MKIKFKGFLEEIGAVVETQNKKGFIQTVIMQIPGYKDPLGQFSQRDQWPMLSVYSQGSGDSKFIARDLVNKIVEVEVNLSFDRILKKDKQGVILENQFMYFPRLFLSSWKLIGNKVADVTQASLPLGTAAVESGVVSGDEPMDEMPF